MAAMIARDPARFRPALLLTVLELREGKIRRYASYWDTNSMTKTPFSG